MGKHTAQHHEKSQARGPERSLPRLHRRFLWLAVHVLLPALAALAAAGDPSGAWHVVEWVADGDTVILEDGTHVRYLGIDAPETAHGHTSAQPFARAARKANQNLVLSGKVRVEPGPEPRDRYGRTLALVYLADGTCVNEEIVRRGLAWFLFYKVNGAVNGRLLEAQRNAMDAGRGMWEGRQGNRPPVVGHRESRRFHLPDCPRARRMRKANRVEFPGMWEAFHAGYAPAGGCLPNWQEP